MIYTPPQWYNSSDLKVSYFRLYKCASSTIIDLLGKHTQTTRPAYTKRFTAIRETFERSRSIYKEMKFRGRLRDKNINSYSEYLIYISTYGYFDKHQLPQTDLLNQGYSDFKEDQKFRIFTSSDMVTIACWIGADPTKIKHINKRTLYIVDTEEDIKIVQKLYSPDLEFFLKLI